MKFKTMTSMTILTGLTMIAATLAPTAWYERMGLDAWNMPKWKREISESKAKSDVLDEEARLVSQRIAIKDHLVKELVDGRVDFASVTEQFRALNDDDTIVSQLRHCYRVKDPRELSALNVIAFAESYLESESLKDRRSIVMHRIDREYDAMFPNE